MAANVAHVQENGPCLSIGFTHAFASHGARHHVARRQLERRMVTLHEALAAIVAQVSALAAQRFGKQKARGPGEEKRGGMKLVELHVGQLGASFGGQRNAVACGHRGVGGIGIDLARAARRDEHRASAHTPGVLIAIEQIDPGRAAVRKSPAGSPWSTRKNESRCARPPLPPASG